MKAWINAQIHAAPIRFGFKIVFNHAAAAEMTENNAQETLRAAEKEYRDYAWKLAPVPGKDLFVVEGDLKPHQF